MEEIKLKGLDEVVYYEKLDNGLPVYMLVNKHVNNFYITLSVKYGSVDTEYKVGNKEIKVHDGVAHFLEHVNFNESEGITAHDYFKKLGSFINAFTTFDFTSYEVMASNKFKSNLEHLLDYVQTPYFTEELINKEKGIIIEEVKMGKNNPGHKLYYGMNKCLYKNDKRRNLVTGEVEDVSGTTLEEIKNVYETFYHPENMFLIITGNFDVKKALDIVKENQKKKTFGKYKKPVIKKVKESIEVNKDYEEIEANVEIPKVKICYKMDKNIFKGIDDIELSMYLSILMRNNFGPISYFREELFDKNLVNFLSAERDIFEDVITLEVVAETRNPKEVIKRIKDKMKHLEVTEEDLIRRRRCNISSLIRDFDDIEYVNSDIAYQLVTYNKLITNNYEIFNRINMKNLNIVKSKLDLEHNSTVVMVPYKS
jgi:predicted Zn-dependent peptidase